MGTQMVTEAFLHTLLTDEVEQVLSGWALTANSDDPHDLQAIMYPSHFVMHRNTIAYPPRFIWKDRSVPSRRWRQVQFLAHLFWKRWLRQYLPSFPVREKGRRALLNLKPNAPVLLVDENASWGLWNLSHIGQKLLLLENDYEDLSVQHDALGIPRRAECLGTKNVAFVNTSQDFDHFSFQTLFCFPRQFSCVISLDLNIVAGALYV